MRAKACKPQLHVIFSLVAGHVPEMLPDNQRILLQTQELEDERAKIKDHFTLWFSEN